MPNQLTESDIEQLAIDLLSGLGYEHIYAPDIAPGSEHPLRNSFTEVLLLPGSRRR